MADNSDKNLVSVIATPLATEKVLKHANKFVKPVIKKADKNTFSIGIKNVNKAIRKGLIKEGILFLGGDITPIDLISHFPVLCEESNIVYVFMPTSEALDKSLGGKLHAGVILVAKPSADKDKEELLSQYNSLVKEIRKIKSF